MALGTSTRQLINKFTNVVGVRFNSVYFFPGIVSQDFYFAIWCRSKFELIAVPFMDINMGSDIDHTYATMSTSLNLFISEASYRVD
jgi:hypothetical protein